MTKYLLVLAGCMVMASCKTGGSWNGSNPLDAPGAGKRGGDVPVVETDTPGYRAGEFLQVRVANTMIYAGNPGVQGGGGKGEWLKQGTEVKFISAQGGYSKVETLAGGIGYVHDGDLQPVAKATGETSVPVTVPAGQPGGGVAPVEKTGSDVLPVQDPAGDVPGAGGGEALPPSSVG